MEYITNLMVKYTEDENKSKKLETITEMITLTAADVNKKIKKSKYYPMQQASIPFTG